MKANTNKKNKSASRKLVPAVAMLTTSAVMLSSATYAWFTLNREVEVTGIHMTATVPEDLQISLGEISGGNASTNLASNNGFLTIVDGAVKDPTNSDDDDPFDWSNTADIAAYYNFGKLIPAGSTNGENVFFTPDAAGVGKTLKATAQSYAAVKRVAADTTYVDSPAATAHVKTDNDTWATNTYSTASAWSTTNDDGYYIDIPVWLRTSSTTAPDVYVTGYIIDGTNLSSTADEDDDELYKAVRVAVLKADGSANGGVLDLSDQTDATPSAVYPATQADITSLIDSNIANVNFGLTNINALKSDGAMTTDRKETMYDTVTVNKGATSLGKLTAKESDATAQYAAGTKFIIRVWLEGDDQNCWNANAGQDWSISLKFMTSALSESAVSP